MSLADHLARQHQRLAALLGLLQGERELLAQGQVDGDTLGELARQKSEGLEALERFEQQRRQAQRRLGYRDDPGGDERAADDAGCLPLWRLIRRDAAEAARLNQLNGVLIGMRMEHNQRLLNVLKEAAGKALYGPDGQARAGGGHLSSTA